MQDKRSARTLTLSEDGGSTLIPLDTILLLCCHIMSVGIRRSSNYDVSIVAHDSISDELGADRVPVKGAIGT